MTRRLDYRNSVLKAYPEVYTPAALEALEVLAPLNRDRRELMARRIARRLARERGRQRIAFLDPEALIPRTRIRVQDARDGNFEGSEIPADLKRQWIQGTGPAAKPRASTGERPPQRRLRAPVGRRRLDVRWRGRPRAGRHHVARQPAQPQARDRPGPTSSCASPKKSPAR